MNSKPQWIAENLTLASVMGIDPDVEWALNEGADYLFPAEGLQWMPVVVEFKPDMMISIEDFQAGKLIAGDHFAKWQSSVRALRLHTIKSHSSAEKDLRFCTALVTRGFFELVWKEADVTKNYLRYVAQVTLGLPLDEDSLPPLKQG